MSVCFGSLTCWHKCRFLYLSIITCVHELNHTYPLILILACRAGVFTKDELWGGQLELEPPILPHKVPGAVSGVFIPETLPSVPEWPPSRPDKDVICSPSVVRGAYAPVSCTCWCADWSCGAVIIFSAWERRTSQESEHTMRLILQEGVHPIVTSHSL